MTYDIFLKTLPNPEKYILVKYFLASTISLSDAAWNLAIGQSVGNPNIRSSWETDELFENHSCLIVGQKEEMEQCKSGVVTIAFPTVNINFAEDGVSHFLCMLMGGQLDIDSILQCHVLDIEFPESVSEHFLGPKFGIQGVREFTKIYNKPLVGGIIKPKTGVSVDTLLSMVKTLVDGGVNFIKEDEILASPLFCRLEDRVPVISEYIKGKNVIYCFAINADPSKVLEKAKIVHAGGGNGIHVNFWAGLGVYKSLRELDLPLFLHFQKSGDKILTNPNHAYHIEWSVICKLATMMGADFIHSGMWGGYMSDNEGDLQRVLDILHEGQTMPALSCGLHPGLVKALVSQFGNDLLLNAGGAIHGHPQGSEAGARALVQAVNDDVLGKEYLEAIGKWGLIKP